MHSCIDKISLRRALQVFVLIALIALVVVIEMVLVGNYAPRSFGYRYPIYAILYYTIFI